jgi:putative ABC transport system permease protein
MNDLLEALANQLTALLMNPISLASAVVSLAVLAFGAWFVLFRRRLFFLALKNLRRNPVRTLLTATATVVLVFMITLIWTVVFFLDMATTEQSKNLKLIITERWQIPSQIPMTYADYLDPASPAFLPELRGLYGEKDFMIWSFYGGTMDPAKRTPENLIFFFAMRPDQIRPMMDDLENLDQDLLDKMKDPRKPEADLVGRDKLQAMNLQVGSRFKLVSINYKDMDLEFEVAGELPDGRYSSSAIMNIDYFNKAFDKYYQQHNGTNHPLSDRRLNLLWIRVPDRATFEKVGTIIENASVFQSRPVKVETASSGIGAFLDAYRDILWRMKWELVPAMLVIMALVMANAISITVRERRTEMAVMKVLGFRPNQVLQLVLGEALLVGSVSGLVAAFGTYALFNYTWGGLPFRIGFFPVFRIPEFALLWGLAIGSGTALLGSLLPAWNARSVKVSEVFSRVA